MKTKLLSLASKMVISAIAILFVVSTASAQLTMPPTPECERQAYRNFNACNGGGYSEIRSQQCLAQLRVDQAVLCGTTTGGGGAPGVSSGTFNLTEWNNWFFNQWWANNGNNDGGGGGNPFDYIEW